MSFGDRLLVFNTLTTIHSRQGETEVIKSQSKSVSHWREDKSHCKQLTENRTKPNMSLMTTCDISLIFPSYPPPPPPLSVIKVLTAQPWANTPKILVNVVRALVRLRLSYGQAMPHLSETGLYISAFRNSV